MQGNIIIGNAIYDALNIELSKIKLCGNAEVEVD
jgi:hypothetical protein